MVRLKREETHTTNDPEPHYHLPSANHNQEIFDRIVEAAKDELPDPYHVVEFEDRGNTTARIQEGPDTLVHLNCYHSDAGRRLKITPHDDEFFEDVMMPIIRAVDAPDGPDLSFRWEPRGSVGLKCDVCGTWVEEGSPILSISSPWEVDAGEIILGIPGIQTPDEFTCCCECAEVDEEEVRPVYVDDPGLPLDSSISPHDLVDSAQITTGQER